MAECIHYLDQEPPGDTAKIFAPGIISVEGRFEHSVTFSPDGNELFFTVTTPSWNPTILQMKRINENWTDPDTASFADQDENTEPFFSVDGQKLYFASNRPPGSIPYNFDIWVSEKDDTTWDAPVHIENVSSNASDYHPSVTTDGTLYFLSNRSGTLGESDIYSAKFVNGQYQVAINLGRPVNSSSVDNNPYISPDESFLIFGSERPGGYGQCDIYVSFKKPDGKWTNPKNSGPTVNSAAYESNADISVDGNYLFFTKRQGSTEMDIYWMNSSIIDSLKNSNFVPYVNTSIPNLTDTIGNSIMYTIPDTTFLDDDNETLTLTAKQSNGNELPDWLTFDSISNSFSGNHNEVGYIDIKVTATDTEGANVSDVFRLTTIDLPLNVDQIIAEDLLIFPIPAKNILYIRTHSNFKNSIYELVDLNGKIMEKAYFNNNTIDISGFNKGIYILRITTENELINKMIVIE